MLKKDLIEENKRLKQRLEKAAIEYTQLQALYNKEADAFSDFKQRFGRAKELTDTQFYDFEATIKAAIRLIHYLDQR